MKTWHSIPAFAAYAAAAPPALPAVGSAIFVVPSSFAREIAAETPGAAAAHHVGVYVPRDNDVSTNFKQLKFSIQAAKFDVAARLFETGALRTEMRAQGGRLPAGLEESTRRAINSADARGAERCLMLFFAALARDLALDADRRLADASESAEARMAAARKFLEAMWRYYNLVDFAVTQYDGKTGVAVRLAFDEADGYTRDPAAVTALPTNASCALTAAVVAPPTPSFSASAAGNIDADASLDQWSISSDSRVFTSSATCTADINNPSGEPTNHFNDVNL